MSKQTWFAATLAGALVAGPAYAEVSPASTWTVDVAHSLVGFTVRHMAVTNVRGRFNQYTATVDLDEKNPANSKVDVSIDVASIDTDNQKRDEHLRSTDFFDAQKHPKITFKSTKVIKSGSGWDVQGNLTMRGVTKPVTLKVTELTAPVKNPWGKLVRGAQASLEIDRYDYGVKWNTAIEAGGVAVSQKVKIELDLQLVKN